MVEIKEFRDALPISECIKHKLIKLFVCVSDTFSAIVLVLLISLNCYMSTLRLVHYALLLTPTCSKTKNTRLMAFAPSLALDPIFRIHSHTTLDTAQPIHLLKPN